ncbi:MAG: alpha/beta hydrolase, partial [Nodosilinea sp.]
MRAAERTSQQPRSAVWFRRGCRAVAWLLVAASLGLSLWIVVPAPTRFLLPLGVGAPEISPWLTGLSAIAAVAVLLTHRRRRLAAIALGLCSLALVFSLLPLMQVSSTSDRIAAEFQTVLGPDYLSQVPPSIQGRLRPQPFRLQDVFRGIDPA